MPGRTVLEIYKRLAKKPKKHILHHLVYYGKDAFKLKKLFILTDKSKSKKLSQLKPIEQRKTSYNGNHVFLEGYGDIVVDYVKKVEKIRDIQHSYCVEIEWKDEGDKNILWGEQILNTRCDGDEACVILLLDTLINFSRKFLPKRRGVTQDAPLVLTSTLIPKEVDNMVFDMDVVWKYPLELYEAALEYKSPKEIKIEQLGDNLGTFKEYEGLGFTHDTDDLNAGVRCSAYKSIPTMMDKVNGQMKLAERLRCVEENDVARLLIERHFMRDIKGNLRQFSQQQFRCVDCNEKYRRPPLAGRCLKCSGRLLFTVAEGSIVKYVEPSLELAEKYALPPYLNQVLQITKRRIESIFGKDPEKQEGLVKWFAQSK